MILGLGLSKYIAEQHNKTANGYLFDDYQRPHFCSYSSNFAELSSMLSFNLFRNSKDIMGCLLT
jgi:hypothetical protein